MVAPFGPMTASPFNLAQLGVHPNLVAAVAEWNGAYNEDKVPDDAPGNAAWLGRAGTYSMRFGPS